MKIFKVIHFENIQSEKSVTQNENRQYRRIEHRFQKYRFVQLIPELRLIRTNCFSFNCLHVVSSDNLNRERTKFAEKCWF